MTTRAMVKLQRELAQVPITAVAVHRDPVTSALYVLAGEDTDLVVYRVPDQDDDAVQQDLHYPMSRVRALSAQPIHGIHVHNGRVLLWGGSSVAALQLSELLLRDRAPGVARLQAPDWIYDGAVCPADDGLVVLVTAHNEVVTARFVDGRLVLASAPVSPSRPMLYAAHVCWTSSTEMLVAAGTVFGDILVWKCEIGGSKPRVMYTLSGHEGSIFGVHVSPLMEMPGGETVRLLASCSDDRTVRLWNITESERQENAGEVKAAPAVGVSDTGFRCAPAVEGGGEGRADVVPIATAMGHASRIWAVKFGLPDVSALTDAERQVWSDGRCLMSVYSFGEDATAQRWSVDVAAAMREPRRMEHEKTYTLHDGKHLWSRAVFCDAAGGVPTTHVLAGGADSKITLVKEVAGDGEMYNGTETWDMGDVMTTMGHTTPAATTKQRKELIGRYDFVTPNILLAVSNMGTVLLATFRGRDATWEALTVEDEVIREDMKNVYAIRTVSHGGALLGSVTGGVYYFSLRDRRVVKVASLAGRVVDMNTLSGTTGDLEALVHLHRDAASVLLTMDQDTGALKRQEALAGLDARFVAMSAARIDDDLLAIGSRHGWVALLRRDSGGAFRLILDLPPASGDAVTAIVPLPCASPTSTKYVLTTSRDGKYRIFRLDDDQVRMTLVHETAPPFGPWIEGAWFTRSGELILYGFRSTDFVVWNETRRAELTATNCGGAHRTFRLTRGDDDGGMRFAFTRTSRLAVHSQRGNQAAVLRSGHHGREVRSVAASATGRYVATGAEDTTIRIWATAGMRPVAYMKRHVVGLQKVQWCRGDEYLFSAGGNEELFAWRVRTLDGGLVAVVCEGVLADKSAREDLRITDLDVSEEGEGGGMLVTVALSDSAVRTYRYTAAHGFAAVCEGRYTGACLTQARHLETREEGGALQVVTAATDGHVALWRGSVGGQYELVQTLPVHQNSVKSLDVVRLTIGGGYGMVTGGDDNSLAWTLLRGKGGLGFQAELGAVVKKAHAAAITGVAILEPDDGEVRWVSVSNDQWVKAWRMPTEGRIRPLGEAYSGVADAGDVVMLGGDSRRVVVAGVGLEVWRLG